MDGAVELAKQVLSQLSYTPTYNQMILVDFSGDDHRPLHLVFSQTTLHAHRVGESYLPRCPALTVPALNSLNDVGMTSQCRCLDNSRYNDYNGRDERSQTADE